jgi:hypothetical protein
VQEEGQEEEKKESPWYPPVPEGFGEGVEFDEQVDVITLAVELDQLGIEVFAHVGKDAMEAVEVLLPEHPAPVFGQEDQVSMDGKNAVPASAIVSFLCHRPIVLQ